MPTDLRVGGYRLFFYGLENNEPPHVHIEYADNVVKFWPNPVMLAMNDGFRAHDLTRLRALVIGNREVLQDAWYGYFGRKV